jgi:tRNA 5-methylaminomethyl-2-thiouridine biosynthesis bifunctional protein
MQYACCQSGIEPAMIPPRALVPAEPQFLPDGTLYSARFDDVYASAAGAPDETRHVFLSGNGLPERWRGRPRFVIVETGFGAGLNFLTTWAAWRETAAAGAYLHFISVEKHPFRRADLPRVLASWPALAALARELIEEYPPLVPGFHRLNLDGGRVKLTLLFGDVLDSLRLLDAAADAFYLDGFAPAKNPDMWTDSVLCELARLARPGATAATYSVARAVRSGLAAAGFAVERRAGFARKRQMLTAYFTACRRAKREGTGCREAIVIGAGLAGTSCAAQLAVRGWQIHLIERRGAPAQEASGNAAGVLMPALSLDWNPPTRLTVQSCINAVRWLTGLSRAGHAPAWERSGVLQLARDEAHFERQCRIVQTFALADELARPVGREQGSTLAGIPVAAPGWWLPSAGWADPASVCRANLAAAGPAVRCLFNREAAQLRRSGDGWEVLDALGHPLARAPIVILANAGDARLLPRCEGLRLELTRGQISFVPQKSGVILRAPVCREGYITPAAHGLHCVGASYNADSDDPRPTLADHRGNLERLTRLLPGFGAGLESEALDGRVGFRTVSPDRMPLVGPVALAAAEDGEAGLFACLGLASRGLTWAPLLAEIVACLATGEPLPVERNLVGLLDPGRFAGPG